MPDVAYSVTTRLPIAILWDFVKEMDNWATFVQGYEHHEKQSETESVWTLKGDVGVLARTVRFRVLVTEWNGPERVRFELEGLNEPMNGSGTFTMESVPEAAAPDAPEPKRGLPTRLLQAIFRWIYSRIFGRAERDPSLASGGTARMTFRLDVRPGGPMAPMVNALMKPMMLPAAEDLANRIVGHLEGGPGARPDA